MKNFLNNLHSLPESTRKKILVVCVGASMALVSFIWVYSMKNKLGISPEKQNVGTEQINDIKKNITDNFNDIKLQGSVYQSTLNNTLQDIKNNAENTNQESSTTSKEPETNSTKDQLDTTDDAIEENARETDELPEAGNIEN